MAEIACHVKYHISWELSYPVAEIAQQLVEIFCSSSVNSASSSVNVDISCHIISYHIISFEHILQYKSSARGTVHVVHAVTQNVYTYPDILFLIDYEWLITTNSINNCTHSKLCLSQNVREER